MIFLEIWRKISKM
ncbi:hypothetical protein FWK35_00018687 [Aphis craccivora]|uniref:Uncharacterized protein n=1 Tax=Aphis craccivora TaxID=307492 RepID=A0A6G0ZPS7_APHCR|nr:hypothetical protein FWK35_00018687 [Aphis craccivora]